LLEKKLSEKANEKPEEKEFITNNIKEIETAIQELESTGYSDVATRIIETHEKKKSATRKTVIAVILTILLTAAAMLTYNIISNRNAMAETVKMSLVGKTMSCTYRESKAFGFSHTNYYYKFVFKNNGTLDYYYSYGRDEEPDYKGTYQYSIRYKSNTTYIISVHGEQFVLTVGDNNNPKSISYCDQ